MEVLDALKSAGLERNDKETQALARVVERGNFSDASVVMAISEAKGVGARPSAILNFAVKQNATVEVAVDAFARQLGGSSGRHP